MCLQNVSEDMLANSPCGAILFALLAHSLLFTTIQFCPRLTSAFCSASLNLKKKERKKREEEVRQEEKGDVNK